MLEKYRNMPVARLLLVVPISVFFMLLNLYPYHPDTLFGWCILLLLSVPVMLVSEFLGDRVLKADFVQKLSRRARIIYVLAIAGAMLGAFALAEPLFEGHLAKWWA
jgi:hypothetical protein